MTKAIAARRIDAEILDTLPSEDPRAIASRRDLVWVNAIMFQTGFMVALLKKHVSAPPRSILEIGSGDGRFMLAVARRMARQWPGVTITLLDRIDNGAASLAGDFAAIGWKLETVTADVFDWLPGRESVDLVTANLFLHHFDHARLVSLFKSVMPLTPLFVATEPCRAAFPLVATSWLRVIGANDVTLHDAAVSIRAAFSGSELSAAWSEAGGTPLEERRPGLFTHAFAGTTR